jgi:hypothetical protein
MTEPKMLDTMMKAMDPKLMSQMMMAGMQMAGAMAQAAPAMTPGAPPAKKP